MGYNAPDLPDTIEVELDDGTTATVRETQTEVTASAGRKVQLDEFEPINSTVTVTAEKPEAGFASKADHDEWVRGHLRYARAQAERDVLDRWEQYVRDESFGD